MRTYDDCCRGRCFILVFMFGVGAGVVPCGVIHGPWVTSLVLLAYVLYNVIFVIMQVRPFCFTAALVGLVHDSIHRPEARFVRPCWDHRYVSCRSHRFCLCFRVRSRPRTLNVYHSLSPLQYNPHYWSSLNAEHS